MKFLLVTSSQASFADFADALAKTRGIDIIRSESGAAALDKLSAAQVDLVAADEHLADMSGITLIKKIVSANPLVNCAVVSSLSGEDFHEATEGLGVLAPLPPNPGEADAAELVKRLEQIRGLTAAIRPSRQ